MEKTRKMIEKKVIYGYTGYTILKENESDIKYRRW